MRNLILFLLTLALFSSPAFAVDEEHDHPPVSPPVNLSGHTQAADPHTGYMLKNMTVTLHTAAAVNLTADDCYGGLNVNADDDVIDFTLPGAAAGLVCCFDSGTFARVVTVDPVDGTDTFIKEGVAMTAGNALDTGGTKGEQFCVVGRDDTYWTVLGGTASLSDGGAD